GAGRARPYGRAGGRQARGGGARRHGAVQGDRRWAAAGLHRAPRPPRQLEARGTRRHLPRLGPGTGRGCRDDPRSGAGRAGRTRRRSRRPHAQGAGIGERRRPPRGRHPRPGPDARRRTRRPRAARLHRRSRARRATRGHRPARDALPRRDRRGWWHRRRRRAVPAAADHHRRRGRSGGRRIRRSPAGDHPMSAAPSRALFLDGSAASHETLRAATAAMIDVVTATDDRGPFPPSSPDELRSAIAGWDPLPDDGAPLAAVLDGLGRDVLARGARVNDPWCAAHLHPPTLISAVAAELAIAATNQSMDSFDQAPAATYAEDHLVTRLTRLLGLPQTATGVLTSGGTASNLLGLLLARDHAAGGPNLAGLPDRSARWRILASSGAHVSIR